MTDADYWYRLNEDCEQRAEAAVDYCVSSWGYGGSEAPWRMYVSSCGDMLGSQILCLCEGQRGRD